MLRVQGAHSPLQNAPVHRIDSDHSPWLPPAGPVSGGGCAKLFLGHIFFPRACSMHMK